MLTINETISFRAGEGARLRRALKRNQHVQSRQVRRPTVGQWFAVVWIIAALCLPAGIALATPQEKTAVDEMAVLLTSFQDSSGSGATDEFCWRLASHLSKELFYASQRGVWGRAIRTKPGSDLSNERLVPLGRKAGSRFVIRAGLDGVQTERSGGKTTVIVHLSADLIAVDTLLARRVLSEGVGSQVTSNEDSAIQWDAISFARNASTYPAHAQAFRMALSQLAAAINNAILSPSLGEPTSGATENPTDDSAADSRMDGQTSGAADGGMDSSAEETRAANADEELRQLVAQAEEVLAGGASVSKSKIESLKQSLAALLSVLEKKSRLLEEGNVTEADQADRQIDAQKAELQTSVTQAGEDKASASDAYPSSNSEKQSVFERISQYVDLAFNVMQHIQEMRATFRGAQQEAVISDAAAVEEPLGEVSGVVTEEGQPVEGAEVSEPRSGAVATTDASGAYLLKSVPPGLLKLVVKKNGRQLANGQIEVLRQRAAMADFQLRSRVPFAGAAKGRLQIIPSLVASSAPLSAANSGVIKGVIEDAQGRAVPRAVVNLRGLAVARTDSHGAYTFTRVPPGVHQLMAFKNGLKVRSEEIRVAPNAATAARFKLTADPAASRRATDRPILSTASAEQNATLRGIITDLGHQPIAGAKVSLGGAVTAVSVRTRTDGSFELSGLRPGTYRLLAGKIGYADSSQTVALIAGRSEQRQIRLTPATLPVRPDVFEQTLRRMGEVRGQVSDRNRQPLANVAIELKAADSNALLAQAKTNARGEYVLKALPGRYTLRIRVSRFGEAAAGIAIESQKTVRKDFELRGGGAAGGASARSETTGHLTGRVSEEQTGRPIVRASVTIGSRSGLSDSTGEFVIRDLSPGAYRATVSRTGYVLETTEVRIHSGETARAGFRLRRAENSSRGAHTEPLTAQVSGRVLDERSSKPIAGASVAIRGRSAATDGEGNFTIAGISPGNQQMTISRNGYASQTRAVALRAGQNAQFLIRLAAQKTPRQPRR